MSTDPALIDRARAWVSDDPDEATATELKALIDRVVAGDASAGDDLADRFDGTLEFGTAGLRGALGAGSNRMNRIVVTRAAAGLAAYLKGQSRAASVVIGYDARHKSEIFAHDTAEVMTGAGLTAYVLPRALPTPVLAYAIRELGCAAGVMVTASHNPPEDNGYKVYLGDGSQIVSPVDTEIAALIQAAPAASDVPRGRAGRLLDEAVVDRYLDTVAELAQDGPRDLRVVYTPIHGVGAICALAVLETAGFAPPIVVPEQEQPDPDFPTVAFPNPEEPGVMDLAIALAHSSDADLILANDPDADRCAVGVPGPTGWQMLRGDEVGALLAQHLLDQGKAGTFAASIVSSSLLAKQAAAAGQAYAETLTGFKWIARVEGLAFGYEEALGYCVDPANVRDKDGISALLLVCEIAATAKADGRTLVDLLDDIARTHGVHATDQLSVRVEDLAVIDAAMERLRANPPAELGGLAVELAEDLADGVGELPPTNGLRYGLAEGGRVIVRPSGTEPKIKCYLEVVVPVNPEDGVEAARIAAAGRLDALRTSIRAAAGL